MDIINEVVTAMRLVKMYCWERKFSEKVQAIRRKELKCYLYKNSIQFLPFRYTGTCTCTCNFSLFFLQEAKPTGRADGPDNFLEQVPGLDTSRSGVRAAGWSAPGCHHLSRVRTGQPSIRESR